jgi:hypothetical protein
MALKDTDSEESAQEDAPWVPFSFCYCGNQRDAEDMAVGPCQSCGDTLYALRHICKSAAGFAAVKAIVAELEGFPKWH